jgi:hypothetical protein
MSIYFGDPAQYLGTTNHINIGWDEQPITNWFSPTSTMYNPNTTTYPTTQPFITTTTQHISREYRDTLIDELREEIARLRGGASAPSQGSLSLIDINQLLSQGIPPAEHSAPVEQKLTKVAPEPRKERRIDFDL